MASICRSSASLVTSAKIGTNWRMMGKVLGATVVVPPKKSLNDFRTSACRSHRALLLSFKSRITSPPANFLAPMNRRFLGLSAAARCIRSMVIAAF